MIIQIYIKIQIFIYKHKTQLVEVRDNVNAKGYFYRR